MVDFSVKIMRIPLTIMVSRAIAPATPRTGVSLLRNCAIGQTRIAENQLSELMISEKVVVGVI